MRIKPERVTNSGWVRPDTWNCGSKMLPGLPASDPFPGSDWTVAAPSGFATRIPVNVFRTGAWHRMGLEDFCRVRIEIVGDGEPSTFVNGTLYRTWTPGNWVLSEE